MYRRVLRQPWIASPRFIGTYRKCGGGFAKTGRALPCPVPARCAGTVDGGTSAHGAGLDGGTGLGLLRAARNDGGGRFADTRAGQCPAPAHGAGRAGLKPAPTFILCVPRNPRPTPVIINYQLP
ncbi:MAG: hypothetical protein LBM98_04200 [Oscillospiraceae bacterium]|nr:hypothetical protein [Oscillospiraceae bacterium]